eukprot:jgi/Bigna1/81324/fgenesh1_pg.79_\
MSRFIRSENSPKVFDPDEPQSSEEKQMLASWANKPATAIEIGIRYILDEWSTFTLALEQSWGGPDSQIRADYMYQDLCSWFTKSKKPVKYGEVESFLHEVMEEDFQCEAEDGSIELTTKRLMQLRKDVLENKNFDNLLLMCGLIHCGKQAAGRYSLVGLSIRFFDAFKLKHLAIALIFPRFVAPSSAFWFSFDRERARRRQGKKVRANAESRPDQLEEGGGEPADDIELVEKYEMEQEEGGDRKNNSANTNNTSNGNEGGRRDMETEEQQPTDAKTQEPLVDEDGFETVTSRKQRRNRRKK